MGSGISTPFTQNLDVLHNQLMKYAGADYDIVTATTLSYSLFVSYITELNKICANYKDKQGCVLVFAVKKGTDATLLWKATVRVACVKLNTNGNKVEDYRLLNIRQFLQVFRRISYECTEGAIGVPATEGSSTEVELKASCLPSTIFPTEAASRVLGEVCSKDGSDPRSDAAKGKEEEISLPSSLGECIICLERKPELILPCCHSYCTPCIEQWWEYCQVPPEDFCYPRNFLEHFDVNEKSCPVCREVLDSNEDTWVISEFPDQKEISEEIRRSLISYATCSGTPDEAGPSVPISTPVRRRDET